MKISKYKNTGLLFELLAKQMISDVYEKGNSNIPKLIKKYYNTTTNLGKEYSLYKLFTEKVSKDNLIRLFPIVLEERSKINNKELNKEKYQLIREIKNTYNLDNFFKNKISNYRIYGALYNLFENNQSPINKIKCQDLIITEIINRESKNNIKSNNLIENLDKDTQKLVHRILIEKFNSKYDKFDSKQKNLLSKYILENCNSKEFKNYIGNEISSIEKKMNLIIDECNNNVLKIKLKECKNLLENINKAHTIKDEHVSALLKYYELINVLK